MPGAGVSFVFERWDFTIHGTNEARTWHWSILLSKKVSTLTDLTYYSLPLRKRSLPLPQHAIRISEWFVGLGPPDIMSLCVSERSCLESNTMKEGKKTAVPFSFQCPSYFCTGTKKAIKERVAMIFYNSWGFNALESSCFYWSYLEPVAIIVEEENWDGNL